jgi:oligopeptide/dipeptide ABC transporter ATP-binding protein
MYSDMASLSDNGSAPDDIPLLETDALTKTYMLRNGMFRPPLPLHAVSGVSIRLEKGKTLGIVGESGCGKSTLSRMLAGTTTPTTGSIKLDGTEVTTLSASARDHLLRQVQMVFQSPYSSLNPRMKVADIVREPLDVHRKDLSSRERRERALAMLEKVGIGRGMGERNPHQLSGGQQQRVGIARALVSDVRLVICDEPVSALDVSVQAQVVNLLRELQQSLGVSYIFVSHDLAVVANVSDDIAVMYLGKVVEYGRAADVLQRPRHPYTQALVDSANIPDPAVEKNRKPRILKGEIPRPTEPPSGCRFRTRCWMAQERCAVEEPELIARNGSPQAVACHFA